MKQQEFDQIVTKTVEDINALLRVKGGEYAGSEDRLANFKRGAVHVGVTPLQVLFVYLSKHYDAFATYVRKASSGSPQNLSEPIEGRLDDLINYCILAKALIKEQGNLNRGLAAPDFAISPAIRDRNISEHRDRVSGSNGSDTLLPSDCGGSDPLLKSEFRTHSPVYDRKPD